MENINKQVDDRVETYRNNPEALQQRYAQNQDLMDLLALQRVKSEKDAAARQMQLEMETDPSTVKQQMEDQMVQRNKDEMMQRVGPTMKRKAAQEQENIQKVAKQGAASPQQLQQGLGAVAQQSQQAPQPQQYAEGGPVNTANEDPKVLAEEAIQQGMSLQELIAMLQQEGLDEAAINQTAQAFDSLSGESTPEPEPGILSGLKDASPELLEDLRGTGAQVHNRTYSTNEATRLLGEAKANPPAPDGISGASTKPPAPKRPYAGGIDMDSMGKFAEDKNQKSSLPIPPRPDGAGENQNVMAKSFTDMPPEPAGIATATKPIAPTAPTAQPAPQQVSTPGGIGDLQQREVAYKPGDYSGIPEQTQDFLSDYGFGQDQLKDPEAQRELGEQRTNDTLKRDSKISGMQKQIDNYSKILNEQQDSGKSKREQLGAFLRGAAGQSSIGMTMTAGGNAMANVRADQEAQVRAGVKELMNMNMDVVNLDTELGREALTNGMAYMQMAKNDKAAAADMASRLSNQEKQIISAEAARENASRSQNEKNRIETYKVNAKNRLEKARLLFAKDSQTALERRQTYEGLVSTLADTNTEISTRIQGGLELNAQYTEASMAVQGAITELQKQGLSKDKRAEFESRIREANRIMESARSRETMKVLASMADAGKGTLSTLQLQSAIVNLLSEFYPEANIESIMRGNNRTDNALKQSQSNNAQTFLQDSDAQYLGGM